MARMRVCLDNHVIMLRDIPANRAPISSEYVWHRSGDMRRHGPMSRQTRRLVWQMVRDPDFHSVLDVGCGRGVQLADMIHRRPGVEAFGMDISPSGIAISREAVPQGTFVLNDATRNAVHRTFDLVLCTDVLEHIDDDGAALANIRALTGRWCLISTLQGRMRQFESRVGHVRNYEYGQIPAMMQQAGFTILRSIDWGFPFYSPLYRDLLDRVPDSATQGTFGARRHALSWMMYLLFCLNSSRRGDYVFCLGEVA